MSSMNGVLYMSSCFFRIWAPRMFEKV